MLNHHHLILANKATIDLINRVLVERNGAVVAAFGAVRVAEVDEAVAVVVGGNGSPVLEICGGLEYERNSTGNGDVQIELAGGITEERGAARLDRAVRGEGKQEGVVVSVIAV